MNTYDKFGREVNIGDAVLVALGADIDVGVVEKFTPTKINVKVSNKNVSYTRHVKSSRKKNNDSLVKVTNDLHQVLFEKIEGSI